VELGTPFRREIVGTARNYLSEFYKGRPQVLQEDTHFGGQRLVAGHIRQPIDDALHEPTKGRERGQADSYFFSVADEDAQDEIDPQVLHQPVAPTGGQPVEPTPVPFASDVSFKDRAIEA